MGAGQFSGYNERDDVPGVFSVIALMCYTLFKINIFQYVAFFLELFIFMLFWGNFGNSGYNLISFI